MSTLRDLMRMDSELLGMDLGKLSRVGSTATALSRGIHDILERDAALSIVVREAVEHHEAAYGLERGELVRELIDDAIAEGQKLGKLLRNGPSGSEVDRNEFVDRLTTRIHEDVVNDLKAIDAMQARGQLADGKQGVTVVEVSLEPYMKPRRSARPIDLPPGYRMGRIAEFVSIFVSKATCRILEETVQDYRFEMVDAEARGKTKGELTKLRVKHWWGFASSLIDAFVGGSVGKIIRAFKGG